MSSLLQTREVSVAESRSPLAFERRGPKMNPGFDRYLLLRGERAFHVGNVCDTCEFFFERLDGASDKVSPEGVAARLRGGVHDLDGEVVRAVMPVLPVGRYHAMLLDVTPDLVQPGEPADYFSREQVELWGIDPALGKPHDPRTEYYRAPSLPLRDGRQFFEFLVPLMPNARLDEETVAGYDERLRLGEHPTALAVSVLDVKQPADWEGDPAVTEHWCLAHYLLDGHHKALAAARAHHPLRLLSFLAPAEGVCTEEDVHRVIDVLAPSAG